MQNDLKLVNINDERFWDILFDEACVEGQQATRIRNELEKIIAYDVEKVVEQIENHKNLDVCEFNCSECKEKYPNDDCPTEKCAFDKAIEYIRNGGKE